MKKFFIITIDTEGDNLWSKNADSCVETKNARYLERFQQLCNRFEFKPVYLTDYEMLNDEYFVSFAKKQLSAGNCEIGMHLHAWNQPPIFELQSHGGSGKPYLIEYPLDIMDAKIAYATESIYNTFGEYPVSHRAGRWAVNNDYYDLLIKHGYHIDCSVTPLISWEKNSGYSDKSHGSDYRKSKLTPFRIKSSKNDLISTSLFEVPMTIRKIHMFKFRKIHCFKDFLRETYHLIFGSLIWLRPNGNNLDDMKKLLELVYHSNSHYIMFMLHSSELMPNGSPTFKTQESIEKLYDDLEILFTNASYYYKGITLKEYYEKELSYGGEY